MECGWLYLYCCFIIVSNFFKRFDVFFGFVGIWIYVYIYYMYKYICLIKILNRKGGIGKWVIGEELFRWIFMVRF